MVAAGFSLDPVLAWQSMRARFMPPLVTEDLPQSLLGRFEAAAMSDRLMLALRFIAPLSTRMAIR